MLRAAWAMWRTRRERVLAEDGPAAVSVERPFRRALVVSLFNPKAILFFVAFFVQFVDPGYAYPALSFVVLGVLAQLRQRAVPQRPDLRRHPAGSAFRRRKRLTAGATSAAGVLFLGFAVKLSLASA